MNRWEGSRTVYSRPWKYRGCRFPSAKRKLPKRWRRPRRAWSNESDRSHWLCKKDRSHRTLCRVASSPSRSKPICDKTSWQTGMGTASAIGFGVAHALPRQPVVVIDGDGAALMKLGVLATTGFYQPSNLLHIILDNEAHDSTGGQQTASGILRFAAVAAAANYRSAFAVDRPEEIREAVRLLRHRPGPSLLHVKIQPGSPEKLGRPTVKPHEVKERFSHFLRSNAK